ncbi:SDR family NAD(P)-dependent oxidoreductase [Pelagibacteraceae bacterium]|nr:SDR family NAD(P)-dependent oxidoreductase [Pelagibacteraceae bacterium]
MKYLIIGASSGLGREIAYSFAKRGHDLILVARDERDLSSVKSDLKLKCNVNIKTISLDFSNDEEIQTKLLSDENVLNNLSGVLFPVGLMFEKDNSFLDKSKINKVLKTNYLSISFLISKLLEKKIEKNFLIVGFGSVSGLLGRNININYAAAKRALESFFESLAFEDKNINTKIQFYTLGYLDTNLSFGKKLILPKGNVLRLAEIVYKNKEKKFLKMYYPFFWSFIAFALKVIPIGLIIKLKNFIK